MVTGDDQPTVLVVEDERALVELYVRWLEDEYRIWTADCGEAALDALDQDVDVVLLDRLMPGMSGDEVLSEIRAKTPDCKIAMVTAVEPDFDVVTMGFDDYLTKPIDRDELLSTVERLLSRSEFAEMEQRLYALVAKRAALQSSKPTEELDERDEFAELERQIDELRGKLDEALPSMESNEFIALVRDIENANEDDPDCSNGGR